MDILTRAERELAAGRVWRAKEILQGVIAGGETTPAVLEAYGRLLDDLGDRVEAGKYLFLSGARGPRYGEAISLFKRRHGRRRAADLVSQLPSSVRRQPFVALPATVQAELQQMGVAPEHFGRGRNTLSGQTPRGRLGDAAAVAVLLLVLLTLAVGLVVIVGWLWRVFT